MDTNSTKFSLIVRVGPIIFKKSFSKKWDIFSKIICLSSVTIWYVPDFFPHPSIPFSLLQVFHTERYSTKTFKICLVSEFQSKMASRNWDIQYTDDITRLSLGSPSGLANIHFDISALQARRQVIDGSLERVFNCASSDDNGIKINWGMIVY